MSNALLYFAWNFYIRLHEFAELERSVRRAQERISSLEEEKRLMQEEVDRLQKNLTDALKWDHL